MLELEWDSAHHTGRHTDAVMRQGCLSWLICSGLLGVVAAPAQADGPLARLRQRFAPPAATAPQAVDPASIQGLMDAQTVAPRMAPAVTPLVEAPIATRSAPPLAPLVPSSVAGRVAVRLPTPQSEPIPPAVTSSVTDAGRHLPPVVTPYGVNVTARAAADFPADEPPPFPEVRAASQPAAIELTSAVGLFEPNAAPASEVETAIEPVVPTPAGEAPAPPLDSIAPQPLSATSTAAGTVQLIDLSGLTLEQAEQLAVSRNPTLQQAAATTNKAQGTRRQIGKYPNPTVGYNADDIGEEGTAGSQGVFLQQTIMLGRKLELNQHVADWEVQALSWQTEAQRLRICNDVRAQFYTTLGAQRVVAIAAEWRDQAAENARLAAAYFQAAPNIQLEDLGTAKNELLLAQVQSQRAQLTYDNAQVELEGEWQRLACLLGEPHMAYTALADTLEQTAGPRDKELAREQLLKLSPVLAQARAEVQRAAWRIQREQAQPIPNVQLQLIGAHGNVTGSDTVSIQAGVPIPLFNNNDGNVMRASSDYRRACWNVQRLELSLQSLLAEQYQQYQMAANSVLALEQQILPAFRTTREEIERNSGVSGVFYNVDKYLAAQLEFDSRRERIQSLVNLRRAEVTLDGLLLTGAFNDLADNEMDDTNRWNALSGQ